MPSKSLHTVLVGLGGTLLIDCWSILLKLVGIKSNGLVYVGRWIAYVKEGRCLHNTIMQSAPVKHELLIGWSVHYLIGISFAFLLTRLYGTKWLVSPSLLPAMVVALLTMLVPLFVFQPVFGFGVAFGRMPNQAVLLLRFLIIHVVYGFGLFLSAKTVHIMKVGYRTNH